MFNVVRRLARRYLVFLIAAIVVLAGFQLIIPAVISTLNLPAMLGGVLALLPPTVGAALGEQVFGGMSATGLLAFGWNHPITHAAGTAVAVVLGARAIAGEIETGTLELVLAQPISRAAYLAGNLLFGFGALLALCSIGVLGTLLGTRIFDIAVSTLGIARVAANFLLLLFALYAATLLASAFMREGGRALGVGVLLAVISFLVLTVALLWPQAAALQSYTLHSYYNSRDVLVSGRIPFRSVAVLGSWIALCLAGTYWRFSTRDVP